MLLLAPSPPHLLTVEVKTTNSIDIKWKPPAIRHTEDRLSYNTNVHYITVVNDTAWRPINVSSGSVTIENDWADSRHEIQGKGNIQVWPMRF